MSELREAAEEALRWMEHARLHLTIKERLHPDGLIQYDNAARNLRAALALPETTAKPVAWLNRHHAAMVTQDHATAVAMGFTTPLYAHPPRDEWRLASEPPEDGTPVIIWFASGGFTKAIALRGKWITAGGRERKEEEVTHWRDVQPPTEGE